MKTLLPLVAILPVVLVGAPAGAKAPAESRARAVALASDLHAVSASLLRARLSAADHQALLDLARDGSRPLYQRARALGLAGVRPGAAAEALWEEARRWPERELRIQAAWAQGIARLRGPKGVSFAQNLLGDREAPIREVGVHLLFLSGAAAAAALAKGHLSGEGDPVVRALIRRRLRERAKGRGPTPIR